VHKLPVKDKSVELKEKKYTSLKKNQWRISLKIWRKIEKILVLLKDPRT